MFGHSLPHCWRLVNSKSCFMKNKLRCTRICPYLHVVLKLHNNLQGIYARKWKRNLATVWGSGQRCLLIARRSVSLLFWCKWAINYTFYFLVISGSEYCKLTVRYFTLDLLDLWPYCWSPSLLSLFSFPEDPDTGHPGPTTPMSLCP